MHGRCKPSCAQLRPQFGRHCGEAVMILVEGTPVARKAASLLILAFLLEPCPTMQIDVGTNPERSQKMLWFSRSNASRRGARTPVRQNARLTTHGTRSSCLTLPTQRPGLGYGAPPELEPGLDANARSQVSGLKNMCHAWGLGVRKTRLPHSPSLCRCGATYLGGWPFLMRCSIPGTTFGPWPLTIFRRPGSNSWKRLSPASLPIVEPRLLNVIAAGRAQ